MALVIVAVLVRMGLTAETPRRSAVGSGVVLGGALGNLIDRALRDGHGFLGGRVVDFIDLQWWPVFNVADASPRGWASACSCSLRSARRRPRDAA